MQRHVRMAALAGVAAAALAGPARAQTAEPIRYESFTLDNGLQFIVHEDHSVPVAHVEVWYDVGSAHEPPGRSGFAHLFEHMMFIETTNLERGRFDALITGAGGSLNGTTNKDRTAYFETVPSNQLNVALWLEADRMTNLVVNEENFRREREVVKEERRLRVDNQPYGKALWEVMDTLAIDYGPYEHSVIGSMEDLDAATGDDAREFYERFYVPNNAAVVVAGDVTVAQVRALAEEYFGHMRRGPDVAPLPPVTNVPRADGPRDVTLTDELATLPLITEAYAIPEHVHPDARALSLLGSILMGGESSRLYQRLVKEEKVALQVGGGASSGLGPGTLQIFALPNQGVDVSRLRTLVREELDRLLRDGVTERELQKVKNQTRAGMIMGRQTVAAKASQLHHYRVMHGEIGAINEDLDAFMRVTTADILRVARQYITPGNRTTLVVRPASSST
ncbi:MAG TPA: pitrilysin family protein [Longimicrobiales bacterium]|nr:pitrilysin family protein [Longimicrobiales bacterium]